MTAEQLGADAETRNAVSDPIGSPISPRFCRRTRSGTDSGRNTVAMMVSCFITSLSRLDTIDMYASREPLSRSR